MNEGPPYFVGVDSLDQIEIEADQKLEYSFPKTSDSDKNDKIVVSVLYKDAMDFISVKNQYKIIITPKS